MRLIVCLQLYTIDLAFPVLFTLLYTGVAFSNSDDFQLNVDSDQVETFISKSERVKHMAPDHYIPGNILFTDGTSLKTTDGSNISLILHSIPTSQVSDEWFSGFIQLNDSQVVLANYHKHCLHIIDRLTNDASVYTGSCMNAGHVDGESARFYNPNAVIRDVRNVSRLPVTDFGNSAIREVDTESHEVSTFFMEGQTLYRPLGITQDSVTGDLYITTWTRIFMMMYDSRALLLITGSFHARFADGPFTRAEFSWPQDVILVQNRTQLLVADNDNHRVRLLDLITNTTSSICTGEPGDVEGDLHSCTLQYPKCLLILGDDLYIGEYRRIVKVSASPTSSTASSSSSSMNGNLLQSRIQPDVSPDSAANSQTSVTQVIIISVSVAAVVIVLMIIVGIICIYKFMIGAKRTAAILENTGENSEPSGNVDDYDDTYHYCTAEDIDLAYYSTIKDTPDLQTSDRDSQKPSTSSSSQSRNLYSARKLPVAPVSFVIDNDYADGMQALAPPTNIDYIEFLPDETEEQLNSTTDANSIIYVEHPYHTTRDISDVTTVQVPSGNK